LPTRDCLPPLEAALTIARELDDRAAETSVLGRLSVVHGNCGRFDLAVETADLAVLRARDGGDERALALALDGRKMAAAHLGDFVVLERCVRELEGLLRRSGDISLLQWAVFESSFEPMARARWDEAIARIGEALALNRQIADRSMESWFLSHLAWIERSRGNLDRSIAYGRQALDIAEEIGHAWCYPFAQTMVGWTLQERSETGRAVDHLRRGLEVAERSDAEFYLVRCLAHLAWSTWSLGETAEALELATHAETMIRAIRTPPGTAFLHGAHAYVALGRVLVGSGEIDRAGALVGPVLAAAEASDWKEAVADTALLMGRVMLAGEDAEGGARRLRQSLGVAVEAGLRLAAAEASAALQEAGLAPGTVDAR
jgi:tetratricopeptide (TPR) repeat protein